MTTYSTHAPKTDPHVDQAPAEAEAEAPNLARRPLYQRTWIQLLGAMFVGLALGAAGASGGDATSTPEFQALETELRNTEDGRAAAVEGRQDAEDEVAEIQAELEAVEGDIPAREKAVKEQERALKGRAAAISKQEAAVAKREKAVGIVEADIRRNTVPGEGVFRVGADMKPGTYRSAGRGGCYYAVLGDANGNNILSNNITNGPALVSVAAGTFFETSRCSEWILQR